MKNMITRVSVPLIAFLFLLAGQSAAVELRIYTWEGYLSQEVIDNFTQKTGISITQVYFDSDQTRDEVIATTTGKSFDIILFNSISAQVFGKSNYLYAVNESIIPNLKNVNKRWAEGCGNFGIPYFYGTVGIVYDAAKVQSPPDSWQDLLRPAPAHQGHVNMLGDMTDVLVPPLIYLGYNINTEEETQLKDAYNILQRQLPYVAGYNYVLTDVDMPGKEHDIHMALAYSGDQYVLNDLTGSENWQYVIPKEGTVIWLDCMSITAESAKRDEAVLFLNYLLDQQVAASNTEAIYASSPVDGIERYLPEDVTQDTELFLPDSLLDSTQTYRIISDDNLRLRKRMLDILKKRHEAQ